MTSYVGSGRTGLGVWSSALLLLLVTGLGGPVGAVSERGKWILDVNSVSFVPVAVAVHFDVSTSVSAL